jgi:hypothetical protein
MATEELFEQPAKKQTEDEGSEKPQEPGPENIGPVTCNGIYL